MKKIRRIQRWLLSGKRIIETVTHDGKEDILWDGRKAIQDRGIRQLQDSSIAGWNFLPFLICQFP
jgi:hypothetical protein